MHGKKFVSTNCSKVTLLKINKYFYTFSPKLSKKKKSTAPHIIFKIQYLPLNVRFFIHQNMAPGQTRTSFAF